MRERSALHSTLENYMPVVEAFIADTSLEPQVVRLPLPARYIGIAIV
jgi:hypothetical protein